MPDVTVSFTDAQWTRVVAASSAIIHDDEGTLDATKLAAKWKNQITIAVVYYEKRQASVDDF